MTFKLAYIDNDPDRIQIFLEKLKGDFDILLFENTFLFLNWIGKKDNKIHAVVSALNYEGISGPSFIKEIRSKTNYGNIPFVLITEPLDLNTRRKLAKEGVSELFDIDFRKEFFLKRVLYMAANPLQPSSIVSSQLPIRYHTPALKRAFDIVVSLSVIICISPILLIISLLIAIESRGPIFYSAKRVGTGYRIFNFYKFRSMSYGADKKLKSISHLNQYSMNGEETKVEESSLCKNCILNSTSCQSILYLDGDAICEKQHAKAKSKSKADTFIKISNDPRITKVGQFIRNTSIDELPQLFNILKGDMSIVGNRPLPLYEAEKLTTDKFTIRFLAPAGLTGLWQVTKRGSSNMSHEERIELDNQYALGYSFKKDLLIILKTIPALLQKENV